MTRRFFVLSAFLLASGFTACTYDDGGVENQNGNNSTSGNAVICATNCPEGYFCDGKSNGCAALYDSGSVCQDNAMCKSGICLNNVCACVSSDDCASGQVCEAGACVTSSGSTGLKGGEACTADSECLTKKCRAGFCGCNTVADCMTNHVCDAGVCRKVEPCPNNGSKNCFSALELYPPENSWNIGKITPSGKDYAGSTFDLYLPQYNVVTCSYPLLVRTQLWPIVKGLGADIGDTDNYCVENPKECELRKTAGCYMVEMNKQTPFTFVLKDGSQWEKHNFYVDYKLSESGIEALVKQNNPAVDEQYAMYWIPQYELGPKDHIPNQTGKFISKFFPGKIVNEDVVVRYEVEKCSPDNFHYDQLAADEATAKANGIVACKNAYQIMVETTPRSGSVTIDSALRACSGDVNFDGINFPCNGVCSEIDGDTTYHVTENLKSGDPNVQADAQKYLTLKGLMYVQGDVDAYKSEDKRCFTPNADGKTGTYKYTEATEKDAESNGCFIYGYPGPVNEEVAIWRSCRTGKILVNEISVLVEVSDDEIAK